MLGKRVKRVLLLHLTFFLSIVTRSIDALEMLPFMVYAPLTCIRNKYDGEFSARWNGVMIVETVVEGGMVCTLAVAHLYSH